MQYFDNTNLTQQKFFYLLAEQTICSRRIGGGYCFKSIKNLKRSNLIKQAFS